MWCLTFGLPSMASRKDDEEVGIETAEVPCARYVEICSAFAMTFIHQTGGPI